MKINSKRRIIVQIKEDGLDYPAKIQTLDPSNSTESEKEIKPGFLAIDCTRCSEECPLSEAITNTDKEDWTHVETTDQIEIGTNGHYYWKPENLQAYCSQQCAVAEEL